MFVRGPGLYKTFGELRRMESLGEWRSSGVLLHEPLVKKAIPEKLVPQSELNLPKVVRSCAILVLRLCRGNFSSPKGRDGIIFISDIVASGLKSI